MTLNTSKLDHTWNYHMEALQQGLQDKNQDPFALTHLFHSLMALSSHSMQKLSAKQRMALSDHILNQGINELKKSHQPGKLAYSFLAVQVAGAVAAGAIGIKGQKIASKAINGIFVVGSQSASGINSSYREGAKAVISYTHQENQRKHQEHQECTQKAEQSKQKMLNEMEQMRKEEQDLKRTLTS